MNTCPKCGSAAVPEEPHKYPSTRIHFACDGYGYTDGGEFDLVYRSELCLEREEKKTLQRKVEALKIDLYFANEAVDQRERSRKETETELRDVKAAGDYWHSKWKEACENARIKHKEVCELKRERNRLIDELQSSTKRETLYVFNNASCKTVAHFSVDENGKHPIDPSVEPITKDKPDWAVKEGYWYEQYQLMRERYHKQIGENSKQAERSRQLEEQLQAKLDDLQASTIHSCGDSCSRPMCVLRRERDAYKRAKQENDERFMNERDEAIQDRDQWRCISASLLVYAESLLAHIPDTSEISWTVLEQARAMFKEGEAK